MEGCGLCQFSVLSQYLLGSAEETHEEPQSDILPRSQELNTTPPLPHGPKEKQERCPLFHDVHIESYVDSHIAG
jgi:hypothetical protein